MPGFFEFEDDSLVGFEDWVLGLSPGLQTQVRKWMEWVVYEPARDPAELVVLVYSGLERVEVLEIAFQDRFDRAHIVFGFNTTSARLALLRFRS